MNGGQETLEVEDLLNQPFHGHDFESAIHIASHEEILFLNATIPIRKFTVIKILILLGKLMILLIILASEAIKWQLSWSYHCVIENIVGIDLLQLNTELDKEFGKSGYSSYLRQEHELELS